MKITFGVKMTFHKYFELVQFDRLNLTDQIKRVLYFVTVYSGLRKEMGAKIIASRIRSILIDQFNKNINADLSPEQIQEKIKAEIAEIEAVLVSDHGFVPAKRATTEADYDANEKVFRLSDQAIKELDLEVANLITGGVKQKFRFAVALLALSVLIVGALWIFFLETTSPGRDQLSWEEISEATRFNDLATPYEEKAAIIVFYITNYIKFNTQMTPEAIAGRIENLTQPAIGVDVLTARIVSMPHVFEKRNNGYVLSAAKIASIESKLDEYHGTVSRVHNYFKQGIANSPGLFLTVTTTLAILIFVAGFYVNYNYVFIIDGRDITLTREVKTKDKAKSKK